jgi:hypothetical protein
MGKYCGAHLGAAWQAQIGVYSIYTFNNNMGKCCGDAARQGQIWVCVCMYVCVCACVFVLRCMRLYAAWQGQKEVEEKQ